MADPVAASDTTVDNADVAYFYTETSTGAFRKTNLPPDALGFVSKTAAQTLTNKTLSDSTTYIVDNDDATKRLQVQVSGITAGATRTLTAPDADGTFALTSGSTFQDSTTNFADNADTTKKFRFEASSVNAGATRVYTAPDKDGTLAMLSDIGWSHLVTTDTANAAAINFTSSTFASTYNIFSIKLRRFSSDSLDTPTPLLRVYDNDVLRTGASYSYMVQETTDTTTTSTALTGQTSFQLMTAPSYSSGIGPNNYSEISGDITIFAKPTGSSSKGGTPSDCIIFWRLYKQGNANPSSTTSQHLVQGVGRCIVGTRCTGVSFFTANGHPQAGLFQVYGARNS